MFQSEYATFQAAMSDLCMAFDKPVMDDRVRVYWDDLKAFPLAVVLSRIRTARQHGKKFPSANELKPQDETEGSGMFTPQWHAKRREMIEEIHRKQAPLRAYIIATEGEAALKRMQCQSTRDLNLATYGSVQPDNDTEDAFA